MRAATNVITRMGHVPAVNCCTASYHCLSVWWSCIALLFRCRSKRNAPTSSTDCLASTKIKHRSNSTNAKRKRSRGAGEATTIVSLGFALSNWKSRPFFPAWGTISMICAMSVLAPPTYCRYGELRVSATSASEVSCMSVACRLRSDAWGNGRRHDLHSYTLGLPIISSIRNELAVVADCVDEGKECRASRATPFDRKRESVKRRTLVTITCWLTGSSLASAVSIFDEMWIGKSEGKYFYTGLDAEEEKRREEQREREDTRAWICASYYSGQTNDIWRSSWSSLFEEESCRSSESEKQSDHGMKNSQSLLHRPIIQPCPTSILDVCSILSVDQTDHQQRRSRPSSINLLRAWQVPRFRIFPIDSHLWQKTIFIITTRSDRIRTFCCIWIDCIHVHSLHPPSWLPRRGSRNPLRLRETSTLAWVESSSLSPSR